MCRRAGYCRLDVPASRPAEWFRDRMVIPEGLVGNQGRGKGNLMRYWMKQCSGAVGGPEIMADQLDKVLETGRQDKVTVPSCLLKLVST